MTLAPAFPLQQAPPGVLRSYDSKGNAGSPRDALQPLQGHSSGTCPAWVVGSLTALHAQCNARGWDLRVTELWRSVDTQSRARQRYLADRSRPYVAPPGRSCHGAGCAIDIHTGPMAASGVTLDQWHALVTTLGWRPIVSASGGWGQSESWHLDCWGPLEGIRRRCGYGEAAMAAHLLTGQWGHLEHHGEEWIAIAVTQASLQRAGFDCGEIDGRAGPATESAALMAGLPSGVPWRAMAGASYLLPTDLAEHTIKVAA